MATPLVSLPRRSKKKGKEMSWSLRAAAAFSLGVTTDEAQQRDTKGVCKKKKKTRLALLRSFDEKENPPAAR